MYSLYFDGTSKGNPGKCSIGYLIKDDITVRENDTDKIIFSSGKKLDFLQTNNFAEYSALLEGLTKSNELGIKEINVYGDSRLVINQMLGKWSLKSENLLELNKKFNAISAKFEKIDFIWIPRNLNSEADSLANQAII